MLLWENASRLERKTRLPRLSRSSVSVKSEVTLTEITLVHHRELKIPSAGRRLNLAHNCIRSEISKVANSVLLSCYPLHHFDDSCASEGTKDIVGRIPVTKEVLLGNLN